LRSPNAEPEVVPSAGDAERPIGRSDCAASIDFGVDGLQSRPASNQIIISASSPIRNGVLLRAACAVIVDNRLSLQQPGGRIADKQLGVAAVHAKHFERWLLLPVLRARQCEGNRRKATERRYQNSLGAERLLAGE
jgi:hypothetical protein